MKKLLNIFVCLSLISSVISCDSFVEVKPSGFVTDDFFKTEKDYEEALIGAYDILQATYWNTLVSVVASDDYAAGGDPDSYDQPTLQNVNLMIHTERDENQIRDIWGLMYAGIERTHYLLENKDALDFSGKEQILAEAYFLRAYYTFELVKFFGNVPLKTETRGGVLRIKDETMKFGEEFTIERVADITTAYALIEEDLKEAIPNLPVSQSSPYKTTKGAAQALLGKVYLYHGTFDNAKFADAATSLGDVISSNKYSLATGTDYEELFEIEGENSPEAVFEIQYTSVEAATWDCISCSQGTYFVKFNGPRDLSDSIFDNGWGFCLPSVELYDLFDSTDSRRDVTFFDLKQKSDDDYGQSRDHTGLANRKFMPRKLPARAGSDPLNYDNNYRAIRYADVLLMAAEAEAQSGGSNGEDYLNEVRARAYGDNSQDYTPSEGTLLDAIYTERRKELAGEGHRFFDLVRTNKATVIDGFKSGQNELFPIPLIELKIADAEERWGQNPGY
ncbi:MAG: RagB/SusD family nutrient uptake outer membrane protein [Flavobacteriaceae bacterium]|nr:RagB/SusD family nutrient uptake outer membrane protein [Flavobacteriaceae bacterium]